MQYRISKCGAPEIYSIANTLHAAAKQLAGKIGHADAEEKDITLTGGNLLELLDTRRNIRVGKLC